MSAHTYKWPTSYWQTRFSMISPHPLSTWFIFCFNNLCLNSLNLQSLSRPYASVHAVSSDWTVHNPVLHFTAPSLFKGHLMYFLAPSLSLHSPPYGHITEQNRQCTCLCGPSWGRNRKLTNSFINPLCLKIWGTILPHICLDQSPFHAVLKLSELCLPVQSLTYCCVLSTSQNAWHVVPIVCVPVPAHS